MKATKIVSIAIYLLIAMVALETVRTSIAIAQDAIEEPTALPTTVEAKSDDYVVTDKEVYRQLDIIKQQNAELQGMIGLLLVRTDPDSPVEPDPVPTTVPTVYINTGDLEELQTIKYIGKVTAGAIVAARGMPGIIGYQPFADWNDLILRVDGIAGGTVSNFIEAGVLLDPPAAEEHQP